MTIINITDHLPHGAYYATCMDCAHDWVADVPAATTWPIECPSCGAMAAEEEPS